MFLQKFQRSGGVCLLLIDTLTRSKETKVFEGDIEDGWEGEPLTQALPELYAKENVIAESYGCK